MTASAYQNRVHAHSLVEYGRARPKAVVLSADLTSSTEADSFRDEFPERFVSMGMAEQNMMSFAGGLARQGLRPLVHDFAVFMYRRSLDQIEMSIAYPALPVTIVGFLPGLTTPGGVSHQAINDVAVLRSIPNMAVLECGDVADVEGALIAAEDHRGPVYVRMIRGSIPRLFSSPMKFGAGRILADGDEILILSSGICTEYAIPAVELLHRHGLEVGHIHVSTLKPFDDPDVITRISRARRVITVENHSTVGGLGSIVADLIADHGFSSVLHRLGIRDTYAHGASRDYLAKKYGIDTDTIIATALGIAGRSSQLRQSKSNPANTHVQPDTPDEAL